MDKFLDYFIPSIFIFIGLVMAYILFVLTPLSLYADAKCLRNGYPKSYVTVGLETYCSTLDGAVTVKVQNLKKIP